MKLSPINTISFKGKIIDAHAHIGTWSDAKNGSYLLQDVFEATSKGLQEGDSIEKIIVSNLDCIALNQNGTPIKNELEGNRDLLKQINGKDNILPLAVCEPGFGDIKNIEQLFYENPNAFYGLKFHPDGHKIMASSLKLDPYLEFAQRKKLPIVFHSGISYKPNSPEFVEAMYRYSSPDEIYTAAKKIPNTPVVMAHMGAGGTKVHKMALDNIIASIENNDAKLYADFSWVDISTKEKPNIIDAIKRLKNTSKGDMLDRLIFGSDAPLAEYSKDKNTYSNYIKEVKQAIFDDAELSKDAQSIIDRIFYKNAYNLFIDKNWVNQPAIKNNKNKTVVLLASMIALITTTYAYLYSKFKKQKSVNEQSANENN